MKLILYGTEHCSLCEQALELLLSMPELAGSAVEVVDVAGSEALIEAYGERLPVLRAQGADMTQVLDWPFDGPTVLAAIGLINQA